ncbi:MAG: radical SAM protein [Candidatus Omnitrophica bacterium]|nr:radical SAM protein [Candidatus Omnitrophota bacterium]
MDLLRILNILLFKRAFAKQPPIFLNIEPTTRCNIRCKICGNREYPEEKKTDLSLIQFKSILRQFPDLKFLCLTGGGEPLLNKDLTAMIRFAKERKVHTGIVSNGTLLNKEMAKEMLETKIDWISFSVDSADKKNFEEIRQGACFGEVIGNIEYFRRQVSRNCLIAKGYAPDISFVFVAMRENIEELPEVIRLAYSIGVKKVFVYKVRASLQGSSSKDDFESGISLKLARAVRVKSISKARELNIDLIFKDFFHARVKKKGCHVPWIASYITSQGYVCPCCVLYDYDMVNFGNVLEEDFSSIWNNQAYKDFRRQFKGNNMPSYCRECTFYRDIYSNINTRFFNFLNICNNFIRAERKPLENADYRRI